VAHPRLQLALVALVTAACLLPFAGKAFHIDDTLFLYAGKQILSAPLDPYGFEVNWDGLPLPMSAVTKNPPLTSYYIALVGGVFGFGEAALHLAFLLPALAVALGTLVLGRRFSGAPVVAALVAVLTPLFLISGTNVMSDVLMLAFWVWAVVCWDRGLRDRRVSYLVVGALLIALAALTKYFGLALVPLLSVYTLIGRGSSRSTAWIVRWVAALAIPIVVLIAYRWVMAAQYGRDLLHDAAFFASWVKPLEGGQPFVDALTSLALAGGGCASVVAYGFIGLTRTRRAIAATALVAWVALLYLCAPIPTGHAVWPVIEGGLLWQAALWSAVGLLIVVLAVMDWLRDRSAASALLGLWVGGTLAFAAFVNWTVNGRSVLPMVPAVGLLVARTLGPAPRPRRRTAALVAATVVAAVLALVPTWADYRLANASRTAVQLLQAEIDRAPGPAAETVWFEGHWGFQYYAEMAGMKPIDRFNPQVARGDWLLVPGANVPIRRPDPRSARRVKGIKVPVARWVSTLWFGAGGGFYSDVYGPLAFGVGHVPDVPFELVRITDPQFLRRRRHRERDP
jgi:4-amino-4-deoxy-L-arabinose transferase-like glycosyltransferase